MPVLYIPHPDRVFDPPVPFAPPSIIHRYPSPIIPKVPSSSIEMSARQAFIPRPPSRVPSSEPATHPTDERVDGDNDMFINRNGKARSISAFLGQNRNPGTDIASQAAGPTQGQGLGRAKTSANRRSFEGILRPEMTPMSIIPYPAATHISAGMKQPGAGQTPRKTTGPGAFEFPRPVTPVSVPRGLKKGFGIFAETREDAATSNDNVHGNDHMFIAREDEADMRVGGGTGIGGYMRMFERSGSGGSGGGLQSNLEHDIIAPVPGYALAGLGEIPEDERHEMGGIFARSSRPLGTMADAEVGSNKNIDMQRGLGGTKRGMRHEDIEENGRIDDEGHQVHGSAKRMKQLQHDPNEYYPLSSPHVPPTPGPPTLVVNMVDPSLVVGSLFENMEEFISLEEVETNWKRWNECTTEEWLKGTDELAKDYADLLSMVKDHLTEKVMAYASMISSVEERRRGVDRNIEMIHGKGNVVRENISKLGTKK